MRSETLGSEGASPADGAAPQQRAPRGLKAAGIIAACAALAIVVTGVVSRHHETDAAQQSSDIRSIPTVQLVSVGATGANGAMSLPGTLQAFNSAKLFARVSGYMKAWYRDIGAHVRAGTPLGLIDTPELDQQIIQARADVASAVAAQHLAKSTADRWADLLSTASVSRQESDEKQGDLMTKSAAVQGARANLGRLLALKSFATICAPFAGVVTARNTDIGDLVTAGQSPTGQPLFSVADVHKIRVYVNVPQVFAGQIHDGLLARLTLPDQPGRQFSARVVGTSGDISAQGGTLQVELLADNPDEVLKPGAYAQVDFDLPQAAGITQVPSSALVFRKNGMKVGTVDGSGHVHLHSITIGRDLGQTVEVTSGLEAGEQVINNPPDSIADGELVRVLRGSRA